MARIVNVGQQDFEEVRINDIFYVDKTEFIKQWWESGDWVTVITRPRYFGKTLNMSMLECFFSIKYAGRSDLFEELSIWQEEKYRQIQGTYPVIALSFADVKGTSFQDARKRICEIITDLYGQFAFMLDSEKLSEYDKREYRNISPDMEDYIVADSLRTLSRILMHYYGKEVIILLDEHDIPIWRACENGDWMEMAAFIRSLYNSTFKVNPYLERAIMAGTTWGWVDSVEITGSICSDLNLKAVTTTSDDYTDCFGFTEEEVLAALEEYGLSDQKQHVKDWYDGYAFGSRKGIYNPWSIAAVLKNRKVGTYWSGTYSNDLVNKLIWEGDAEIKESFGRLLCGESIKVEIDELVVYNQLAVRRNVIWSFLLADGYLALKRYRAYETEYGRWKQDYELKLVNVEVQTMFLKLADRKYQ